MNFRSCRGMTPWPWIRSVLHEALQHIIRIVDWVPFNAEYISLAERQEVKETMDGFIETLEILKDDENSGFPVMRWV